MSYHILGLRLLFESLAHTSGGAIGLLNNHMNINNRIKYLMETNEVLSRIFIADRGGIIFNYESFKGIVWF